MVRNTTTDGHRHIVLQPRDIELLECVSVLGYVSSATVAREFFPSEDRASQRVRLLVRADLLAVTLAGARQPHLLSLTRRGLAALSQHNPLLATAARLPGTIRRAAVAHHSLLSEMRLYVRHVLELHGHHLLEWSNAGGRLHVASDLAALGIVPDSIFDAEADGQRVRIAVEADTGTESLKVIARKAALYAIAVAGCDVDKLWFVALGGAGRRSRLAQTLADGGIGDVTRLFSLKHIVARPILDLPPVVAETQEAIRPILAFSSEHNGVIAQGKRRSKLSDNRTGRSSSRRGQS